MNTSSFAATVRWLRGEAVFTDDAYSRGHVWEFDGGLEVAASASPHIVPLPMSVAENVDPEEAFVAALSSCHMLFFLSLAQKKGLTVDSYMDKAVGQMGANAGGRTAITRVVLRPDCRFSGEALPTRNVIDKLHHQAHRLCFIANSVNTDVVIEAVGQDS
jgi:organic hydroperoxide reductase OsmC/OhrA